MEIKRHHYPLSPSLCVRYRAVLECQTMTKDAESRRLRKITGASKNLAKRYRLPETALRIIEKAGKIHGQQSRAIQVAVELIWNAPGYLVNIPESIIKSPKTGKTFKLPPRTVGLIEALAREYETQGNVLAACAVMLSRPDPRGGLTKAPEPTPAQQGVDPNDTKQAKKARLARTKQLLRETLGEAKRKE